MRDAGHDDVHAITLRYEEFRDRHDDEAPLAGVGPSPIFRVAGKITSANPRHKSTLLQPGLQNRPTMRGEHQHILFAR